MGKITFPESLYEQYRDAFVSRPPQHRYWKETVNGAAVSLNTAAYVIPPDLDCMIGMLGVRTSSGAAQSQTSMYLQITPPFGDNTHLFYLKGPGAVNNFDVFFESNGLYLEASSQFQLFATFSGGGAANQLGATAMLCFFPRMKF